MERFPPSPLSASALIVALYAVFLGLTPSRALSQDPTPPSSPVPVRSIRIERIDSAAFPKVNLDVTVFESGAPKVGLQPGDFTLTEAGALRQTAFLPPPPRSFALVVDTSGSMVQNMAEVKSTLKKFIAALAKDDQAAIISFSRSVSIAAPLQADKAALRSAADNLVANGESALYDALASAAETLKDAPNPRTILLVTDSKDDDGYGKAVSSRSAADALAAAKANRARISAFAIGEKPDMSALEKWAGETGGVFRRVGALSELESGLLSTLSQTAASYTLSFTSGFGTHGQTVQLVLTSGDGRAEEVYRLPLRAPAQAERKQQAGITSGKVTNKLPAPSAVAPSAIAPSISAGMNSAVPAAAGAWLPSVRNQYYFLEVIPGKLLRATLLAGAGQNCGLNIFASSSPVAELRAANQGSAPFEFLVPSGFDSRIFFSTQGNRDCAFMVQTRDLFDAETRKDAGTGESSALPVVPLEDIPGYVSAKSDSSDYYKLTGLTASSSSVIVRPSANCSLVGQILNNLGEKIVAGRSQNTGAGFALRFEARANESTYLRIEAEAGHEKICAYVFRFGAGELGPPAQPDIP